MKSIKGQLDQALISQNYDQVKELLEKLENIPCTKEELETSKIGATVNRIRKMEEQTDLSEMALNILVKWKTVMLKEAEKPAIENKRKEREEEKKEEVKRVKQELSDPIRSKCVEMLCNAMMQEGGGEVDEMTMEIALQIERALFTEFKNTEAPYKAKFRSKYLNLKDKQNGALREGLRSGFITPERFIAMTSAVKICFNCLGNGQ